MSWLQLSLTTDDSKAPLVQLLFENMGALSVTFGDAGDEPMLEPDPGATPLWSQTRITALFDGDSDAEALKAAATEALAGNVAGSLAIERLEDREWERAWLDSFHPMKFGDHLWICPDGQLPDESDAVIVELDPGLAFGSGTHPTTALCLEWLGSHDLTGAEIIDFGSGSGILGVAALKLGAHAVLAVDHDPQALIASQDNARKNRVDARMSVSAPQNMPRQTADIVLANILAGTLVDLEPRLAALTRPGGRIILSGILADQAESVIETYRPDFTLQPPQQREDWVLIEGSRNP